MGYPPCRAVCLSDIVPVVQFDQGEAMNLRPYQTDAAQAALSFIRKCTEPCLIEAPTGAGKSWIIAKLAHEIRAMSGKKILVLAPSAEPVEQDAEKFATTGEPFSIYSASTGKKSLRHPVVFGSPLTVANNLDRFKNYAAVIIDEAHGITKTLKKIISHLVSDNPRLRVIGLSATPYRMNTGRIYAYEPDGTPVPDDEAVNPFFHTKVYTIEAQMLIDEGYLTRPVFEPTADRYDTSGLSLNRTGNWDAASVDQAFVGKGRKTASIVSDIVAKSRDRSGVMVFASTIKHAHEVCESLPPQITRLVTGETPKTERDSILRQFKSRQIKYLVNVAVLTTGFDASHVDVVAILRATESVGLLQQIIGRGLRIDPGKRDCLVLDYAENLERHCPDDDVFSPVIRARISGGGDRQPITCPSCGGTNMFLMRKNPEGYDISADGYFVDPLGAVVRTDSGIPIPAHMGRACKSFTLQPGTGKAIECGHKWAFKLCPECEHENDVAARYCTECKAELVDPNEKLKIEAAKLASDPYATRIEDVHGWKMARWPGRNGKPDTLKVDFYTDKSSVSHWYAPESTSAWIRAKWHQFCDGVWGERVPDIDAALDMQDDARMPVQIAFRKKKGSKYFDLVGVEYDITK